MLERRSRKMSPKSQKEATLTSSSSGSVPNVGPADDDEDDSPNRTDLDTGPAGWVGTTASHSCAQEACANDELRPWRLRCSLVRNFTI